MADITRQEINLYNQALAYSVWHTNTAVRKMMNVDYQISMAIFSLMKEDTDAALAVLQGSIDTIQQIIQDLHKSDDYLAPIINETK